MNYKMMTSHLALFGITVFGVSSFLIDQSTTPNPAGAGPMSDKQYYTLLSMISELNTFTRKLQRQMTKLSKSVDNVESLVSQGKQDLKNETEELRQNYTDVTIQLENLQAQQEHLVKEFDGTKTEIKQIANSAIKNGRYISEVENKTNSFERELLVSNNELQSLRRIENISSAEFLSIYNRTLKTVQVVKNIQTNMTLNYNMIAKKKVAVTSCTNGGEFNNASFIDFTEVKSSYGLNKIQIENFKKDRKFSCRVPGLYFISAHVMSFSISASYRLVKNDTIDLGRVEFTPDRDYGTGDWHTGTGSAVAWLNTKDTLGIQVWGRSIYIGSFSCMTIVQIQ